VGNMHANFQASSSSGVGGGDERQKDGGDRWKDGRHAVFGGNRI